MSSGDEVGLYDDDEPLERPTWMKVAAIVCLVAAVALIVIGMIP